MAVATNSELIKVYEVDTWACQILHGHTDIVMALDVYKKGNLIVSGSKVNIMSIIINHIPYKTHFFQAKLRVRLICKLDLKLFFYQNFCNFFLF